MRALLCGVRGSTPAPGAAFAGVGGHTSCVAVPVDGGRWIVLDAGTGLRRLTDELDGGPLQGAIARRVAKGKTLPEQIQEHIVAKTDGVPLFIEELTKTVLESGLLREDEDRYELAGAIPPFAIPATLHDSLMARLDQLPSGRSLRSAAPSDASSRTSCWPRWRSMPDAELGAALDQLVDAQLMVSHGTRPHATYTFKHALVQDAAYGSLLLARRQALHARIVEVLETQFPESLGAVRLLAHHCTEARLGQKALHYWQLAGRRASERSANVEAISHLTRGLDLVATLPETAERRRQELDLLLAGPVLMNTKGPRTREVAQTYSRARELCSTLPDSPQHFAAMWGSWRIFEHFETALEIAQKLLKLAHALGDSGLTLQAHHCLWASLFHLGRTRPAGSSTRASSRRRRRKTIGPTLPSTRGTIRRCAGSERGRLRSGYSGFPIRRSRLAGRR